MSLFKTIDSIHCPHCNKNLYLSVTSGISNVSSKTDLDLAKKKILEEVEKLIFATATQKQETLDMINSEGFIRGLDDVDETIKQIGIDICEAKSKK